jgi:hypothetical protein
MKQISKFVMAALCVLWIASLSAAYAESKYAAGATAAGVAVNFGAGSDAKVIKYVAAKTGTDNAEIKIYARSGSPCVVTTASESGSNLIYCANTASNIAAGDLVIYQHADGTLNCTTTTATTATSVTLATALTKAGTVNDVVYELSQQGSLWGDKINGTQAVVNVSGDIFKSPANSPIRIAHQGTTNSVIMVTVQ